ncbi:hypothetical protein RB595_010733 [Gaeumannomyces hyphopodioides]
MESQCEALSLSASVRCTEKATSSKGHFCGLHARQCMALYRGYKRRNARLDRLDADPPAYLKTCPRALTVNRFQDVKDEATVDGIRTHLFSIYNLLDQVISARRLHQEHFYPQKLDYGHKTYIDRLVTRRKTTLRALEALEKRRTQEDEESQREKEQKRVKLEAALWRRHWRELQTRLRATKEKEDLLAQEAFLDEAWKERHRQDESAADELDDDEGWDPIEDVMQEDREKYLDLLRHFLWLQSPPTSSGDAGVKAGTEPPADAELAEGVARRIKGKNKKRNKKKKKRNNQAQSEPAPATEVPPSTAAAVTKEHEPDRSNLETMEDIRRRLKSGLLSHAALLPIALRSGSVEEFLADPALVDSSELRDLCLQIEKPTLQALRDACADFARGDADDGRPGLRGDELVEEMTTVEDIRYKERYRGLDGDGFSLTDQVPPPKKSNMLGPSKKAAQGGSKGEVNEDEPAQQRMKIRFSIMARDCSFDEAVELCRNFDEFEELNLLARWNFFPASKWNGYRGDWYNKEFGELGLFPFLTVTDAKAVSHHIQTGSRVQVVESRNLVCATMKRNHPATCRFIHYYDVYIWDYRPGRHHHELMNKTLDYLRRAHKIRKLQDQYHRQKHVLETLYQDKTTYRIRQIRPGDDVSVFDMLTNPTRSRSAVPPSHERTKFTEHGADENIFGMYGLYNNADAAEDEVLFPQDKQCPDMVAPFKEIRTPVDLLEEGLPPKIVVKGVADDKDRKGKGPVDADNDEGGLGGEGADEEGEAFMWYRPPIWEDAADQIAKDENLTPAQKQMLDRLAFSPKPADAVPLSRDETMTEVKFRDRGYAYKQSFHLGDVEPGAQERYAQVMRLIIAIQNQKHEDQKRDEQCPTDWAWFCLEILDWLNLQAYYDDFKPDSWKPWPHRYIAQDITQAFVTMALFFPELPVSRISRGYLDSPAGAELKSSQLFDPAARAATLPDRRTARTSYEKPPGFWEPLTALEENKSDYFEKLVPMKWSVALRPIIAQLYKSGVIALEHKLCPDIIRVCSRIMAAEEPHRPGKLDMFVKFEGQSDRPLPPSLAERRGWPELLPLAQAFANKDSDKKHARFAVLRIWSAPHFWPYMLQPSRQDELLFHDLTDRQRVWKWRFAPKDMPASEWGIYNVLDACMLAIRDRLLHGDGPEKAAFFNSHVAHRGDVFLVMGKDQEELLRLTTLVTFTLQGKPWLREMDVWKSFINALSIILHERGHTTGRKSHSLAPLPRRTFNPPGLLPTSPSPLGAQRPSPNLIGAMSGASRQDQAGSGGGEDATGQHERLRTALWVAFEREYRRSYLKSRLRHLEERRVNVRAAADRKLAAYNESRAFVRMQQEQIDAETRRFGSENPTDAEWCEFYLRTDAQIVEMYDDLEEARRRKDDAAEELDDINGEIEKMQEDLEAVESSMEEEAQ